MESGYKTTFKPLNDHSDSEQSETITMGKRIPTKIDPTTEKVAAAQETLRRAEAARARQTPHPVPPVDLATLAQHLREMQRHCSQALELVGHYAGRQPTPPYRDTTVRGATNNHGARPHQGAPADARRPEPKAVGANDARHVIRRNRQRCGERRHSKEATQETAPQPRSDPYPPKDVHRRIDVPLPYVDLVPTNAGPAFFSAVNATLHQWERKAATT